MEVTEAAPSGEPAVTVSGTLRNTKEASVQVRQIQRKQLRVRQLQKKGLQVNRLLDLEGNLR